MVESNGLENRRGFTSPVGSNPTPSAIFRPASSIPFLSDSFSFGAIVLHISCRRAGPTCLSSHAFRAILLHARLSAAHVQRMTNG